MTTNELGALIIKNMANQLREEAFNPNYEPKQSEPQAVCQVQTTKPQRRLGLLNWLGQRQPHAH